MKEEWSGLGHGARMVMRGLVVRLRGSRQTVLEIMAALGGAILVVAVLLPFIRGVSLHHVFALWILVGVLVMLVGAFLAQTARALGVPPRPCGWIMAVAFAIGMASVTLAVALLGVDLGLAVTAMSIAVMSAMVLYLLVAGARAAIRTSRHLYDAGMTSLSAHERLHEEARRRGR